MRKRMRFLFETMNDDLKDADMLIEYATDFAGDGRKEEAVYYMNEATKRLESFNKRHTKIAELIGSVKNHSTTEKNEEKDYRDDITEMFHKHYMEWYERCQSCLTALSKAVSALS